MCEVYPSELGRVLLETFRNEGFLTPH